MPIQRRTKQNEPTSADANDTVMHGGIIHDRPKSRCFAASVGVGGIDDDEYA